MDFERAERRYFELKGRLDTGAITPAEFEAGVRELTVTDAAGRAWMIGAQSGNWYYADAGRWVAGQPPRTPALVPVPAPTQVAAYAPAASTGASGGKGMILGLAAGLMICGGVGVVAALFLPQSPFRLGAGPAAPTATGTPTVTATATVLALQVVTATPTPGVVTATPPPSTPTLAVVTATPLPATPTPAVVTATPPPPTLTPVVVTATPVPPTVTPIFVVVTATPTATPPPTLTPTKAPPTPTSPPPAPPTATTPPTPSRPALDVTLSNPHYERWGKPTNPDGCNDPNNGIPVRRFTMQLVITNRTSQTVSGDWGPRFYSNTGATLSRCYYDYSGAGTVPPGQTRNVTFVTYTNTDGGDWVSRVVLSTLGGTWTWTLGPDATILTYP